MRAGCDVTFWTDHPIEFGSRIELIIWSDYSDLGYEEQSVFLSEAEAVEMVDKLEAALKELRAFANNGGQA